MAIKLVGYRSPFQKKASPMKAMDPATAQALLSAAPGIISAFGSLFGRKKRRREQKRARQQMLAARKAYMNIEFKNPLEGVQNPYADLENPYAENIYEDLTIDKQAADYLREQQQQSQANIMQQMKGVAGASGVAGLAQQMANVGSQQARQAAAEIAKQERQNELYRAKGEQQKQKGTFEFEKMMKGTQFKIDLAKREAQQKYVTEKEQERMENLYGLSLSRLSAADQARSTARSGFVSGLGQAIAGFGGTFMPGGVNYPGGPINASTIGGLPTHVPTISGGGTYNWPPGSDRKLKKDINLTGQSPSGLNIYSFKYKDESFGSGTYQGVMADEIPSYAVISHPDGYDMVDYSKIDVDFIKI